ncbi:putative glycosyltransferase EpsJ [Lachnospiraceae bacterium]|nr:putative glycosyltransferase EpsJ [Lachnospiraceae bacterium]
MISIIVPIYNIENYLPQCIESIMKQTYTDLEILLVDDGSKDSCSKICDKYKERDSRIKVIHKENGGLVSARKAGLVEAQGEYVAYVDGDDWIEANMFMELFNILDRYQVDIVMCGHIEDTGNISKKVLCGLEEGYYDKRQLIETVYPSMIAGDAFFDWNVSAGVWGKLFKKESIMCYQMAVDERICMGEDAACTYPALLNAHSIYVVSKCLYHYRQTTGSMVKNIQNYEKEREQFGVLFSSVNHIFEKYSGIFDLREQWLKYVLFLMIPRADGLYKNYDTLDYLFPFKEVYKGSNIILYGAGTYGQRLYNYLKRTRFCNVVLWLDRNYTELRKMGLAVNNPIALNHVDCDIVLIANTYEKSRNELFEELTKKYPEKKIYMMDVELIFSEETKKAFGLEK